MKKIFKIEFVFGLIIGSIIFYSVRIVSYRQGYLQSIRDRISELNLQIDSLNRIDNAHKVESFFNHSEIREPVIK